MMPTMISVFFINQNVGWAVGRFGYIYYTMNGGVNWIIQRTGVGGNEYLYSVYFITENIGWVVGTAGLMLRTTNGGGLFEGTTITANATAGSQIIEVANVVGFSEGDSIVISPGALNQETNTITGFGSIHLQTPLIYDHQAGEIIQKLITTSVEEEIDSEPDNYLLSQNYPNPFNPTTKIKFAIPKETKVNLSIYNVLGELISTLVNEEMKPCYYQIEFNGSKLASGLYIYRILAGDPSKSFQNREINQGFVETRKMILIK